MRAILGDGGTGLLRRSLMARLLFFLLLFAVLPLGAVGYIAYRSGQQSITDDVAFHIESVAILKEQEIRSWVRHLEHTLTWLATEPQVAGRNSGGEFWTTYH